LNKLRLDFDEIKSVELRKGNVTTSKIGFAVIYRWRIRPGCEDQFQKAWATTTKTFMADRAALGSRLHHADGGTWVAYAQWPTRQAWQDSLDLGPADPQVAKMMRAAIEESFEPALLEPVRDYLQFSPEQI